MVNSQKDLVVEELLKNKLGLQVLTDSGWSDFDALHIKGTERTLTIKTDRVTIVCTPTHKFYTNTLYKIEASALTPGTKLYGRSGIHSVVSITANEDRLVYDLINVAKNNRFYANDILVSNCEFIIYDETLINPIHLLEMVGLDPIERQGQVRWYKRPERERTYIVALDPSLGTGSDPAAIQIYELPGLKQIGEWSHNKTPVQRQVVILKEICHYLAEESGSINNVYYSVENNTLGEAALVVIDEIGEENLPGIFLSEPRAAAQGGRRYRKGFNTTNKSKLSACAKFKSLIETRRMTVASKLLISEMKTFVASGQSYAAKLGDHDDLVMATLLAIRMAQMLQNFDSSLDSELRDSVDAFLEPMPFILI